MPTIYDNIEKKFADGVLQHVENAKRVDYCVGYFNIRGWNTVVSDIDKLEGMEVKENGKTYTRYCRLLVGMTKNPFDILVDELNPDGNFIDNEKAAKMKRKLAEDFKKQLEIGVPTNADEKTIKKLLKQLKEGKVVVKLFLEYQLHAKLYLYGRDDYSILDTVLKEYLPRYFDDVTKGQIQKWQDTYNYKAYNDYITRKLDELGITVEHRKRKFDHFVWYKNR